MGMENSIRVHWKTLVPVPTSETAVLGEFPDEMVPVPLIRDQEPVPADAAFPSDLRKQYKRSGCYLRWQCRWRGVGNGDLRN